jgi:hypothetical protein
MDPSRPRPLSAIKRLAEDFRAWCSMPTVRINLKLTGTTGNDPFFQRVVKEFHRNTLRRSRKLPLLKDYRHGVALCILPYSFDAYFVEIEASARRNYKTAVRNGYEFARIDYNAYLNDVAEIWRSTDTRQGRMPAAYLMGSPKPHSNPTSSSTTHDYPYFGAPKEGRLVAYAGAFVSGDIFVIQTIFGHAGHSANGVVPMLVIGMANVIFNHRLDVRFYAYGMYFGAGENMRRFKDKLCFRPHHVAWMLGGIRHDRAQHQLVYRMRRDTPLLVDEVRDAKFVFIDNPRLLLTRFRSLCGAFGALATMKPIAKIATVVAPRTTRSRTVKLWQMAKLPMGNAVTIRLTKGQ